MLPGVVGQPAVRHCAERDELRRPGGHDLRGPPVRAPYVRGQLAQRPVRAGRHAPGQVGPVDDVGQRGRVAVDLGAERFEGDAGHPCSLAGNSMITEDPRPYLTRILRDHGEVVTGRRSAAAAGTAAAATATGPGLGCAGPCRPRRPWTAASRCRRALRARARRRRLAHRAAAFKCGSAGAAAVLIARHGEDYVTRPGAARAGPRPCGAVPGWNTCVSVTDADATAALVSRPAASCLSRPWRRPHARGQAPVVRRPWSGHRGQATVVRPPCPGPARRRARWPAEGAPAGR